MYRSATRRVDSNKLSGDGNPEKPEVFVERKGWISSESESPHREFKSERGSSVGTPPPHEEEFAEAEDFAEEEEIPIGTVETLLPLPEITAKELLRLPQQ
jgi:hypothetical protein